MMLLEGVRVIDWGLGQVGPYATMLLGDLGAEVIKIEPPDTGDFMRRLSNFLTAARSRPSTATRRVSPSI
jgi:crotonobetainyl-CoA:carnitine CoA-transferase CaiB-like acyl-CoA transferase